MGGVDIEGVWGEGFPIIVSKLISMVVCGRGHSSNQRGPVDPFWSGDKQVSTVGLRSTS